VLEDYNRVLKAILKKYRKIIYIVFRFALLHYCSFILSDFKTLLLLPLG